MPEYPTAADVGRPPNVCGNCGQQWWGTHVCPNLPAPMSQPFPGALPVYPQPPLIQMVNKEQLDAANAEIERLRDALKVAHDFIAYHPAVVGNWPLVLGIVCKALHEDQA